jgi:aryl-alcohol dehydrogenase-like predicted oxidoreductase
MEDTKKNNMIYRYLGNTGVKISAIAMGTMESSKKPE